jgi:hypothetical protein
MYLSAPDSAARRKYLKTESTVKSRFTPPAFAEGYGSRSLTPYLPAVQGTLAGGKVDPLPA